MTYTYDLTTDIGRMRLLIPDKSGATTALYTDEELTTFFDMEGDYRRGTALALESLASNDALILKLVRVQDLEVTGTDRLATFLLKRAQSLRDQAASAEVSDGFDVITLVYDDNSYREQLKSIALREG